MAREKKELERSCNQIFEERNRASGEINLLLETKKELDKHALSVTQDMPKLEKIAKAISEYDYDVQRVLAKFENLQYHEGKLRKQNLHP